MFGWFPFNCSTNRFVVFNGMFISWQTLIKILLVNLLI